MLGWIRHLQLAVACVLVAVSAGQQLDTSQGLYKPFQTGEPPKAVTLLRPARQRMVTVSLLRCGAGRRHRTLVTRFSWLQRDMLHRQKACAIGSSEKLQRNHPDR